MKKNYVLFFALVALLLSPGNTIAVTMDANNLGISNTTAGDKVDANLLNTGLPVNTSDKAAELAKTMAGAANAAKCAPTPQLNTQPKKKQKAYLASNGPQCFQLCYNSGQCVNAPPFPTGQLDQILSQLLTDQLQKLIDKALSGGGGGGGGGGDYNPDYLNASNSNPYYYNPYDTSSAPYYDPYPNSDSPSVYYDPNIGTDGDGATGTGDATEEKGGAAAAAYYECQGSDCSGSDDGSSDNEDSDQDNTERSTNTNDRTDTQDDSSYGQSSTEIYGYGDDDILDDPRSELYFLNEAGFDIRYDGTVTHGGQEVIVKYLGPDGLDRIEYNTSVPVPDELPFGTEAGYLDGVAGYVYSPDGFSDEGVFITIPGEDGIDFNWEDVPEESFWSSLFTKILSPFTYVGRLFGAE